MISMALDFVEIGTSNFNTLLQKAKPGVYGLSVEPVLEYLGQLPSHPTVQKINVAVSNTDGEMDLYLIPPNKMGGLPAWMRGTNSIGHPHPTVVRYLRRHNLSPDLIERRTVPIVSVATLLRDVTSIGYLKIDTEGHDAVILNAFLDLVATRPSLLPHTIRFEANSLSSKADIQQCIDRLKALQYDTRQTKSDVIATVLQSQK